MRKLLLLACFGITAAGLFTLGLKAIPKAAPDSNVVAADPSVRQVAAANTDFGFRLLVQLNKSASDKNVFFSPFSVTDAVTMAMNGAGGATQHDMAATLGLKALTLAQINQANGLLLPSLANPDPKVELTVANALWARKGTSFSAGFQRVCRNFYEARTDTLDFRSPAAADTINGWVKDNTHGKIDQLVSPSDLVQATAVLTNAVYFHGQWQTQFDKAATREESFWLERGGAKTVPLMSQVGSYPYLETANFQAVSLPYGTGRMSLYVFLPKPGNTLNGFVNGLTRSEWERWIGQMTPTRMTIILPRFKAEYEATLKSPLTALGMGSAFGGGADFRPMGLPDSFISEVIHKAILEVNEEGTVAAAATGVIMTRSVPLPPDTTMRVDHPFFCAIRDNTTGTLLFAGAIRDPQ